MSHRIHSASFIKLFNCKVRRSSILTSGFACAVLLAVNFQYCFLKIHYLFAYVLFFAVYLFKYVGRFSFQIYTGV
jgi:hypothetical protein